MIVECSNCQTRFQLDDSRVPLRGIRVRCSRCKEAFFLEHPDTGKQQAIDDVAEQSLSSSAPDPTEDLESGVTFDAGLEDRDDADFDDSGYDDGDADPEPEEEADWEFNQEPGGGAGDRGAFRTDSDDEELVSDDGEASSVPGLGVDDDIDDIDLDESGLDLAGDEPVPASEPGPQRDAVDFDGAANEAEAAADDDDDESDFGVASDFSARELGGAAPPSAEEVVVEISEDERGDATGDSDDWDFFGDDALEAPSPFAAAPAAAPREEVAPAPVQASGPSLSADASSEPSKLIRMLSGLGRGVGWVATLALLGFGLYSAVLTVAEPAPVPRGAVALGDLKAVDVRATWYPSVRATHLYAVEGRLQNDGPRAVLAGRGTRVALLDAAGQRLPVPESTVGLPLAEAELRELAHDALRDAADRSVDELAKVRLEPGQTIAFLAFFDGLPAEAASFLLETSAPAVPAPARAPEVALADEPRTTPSSDPGTPGTGQDPTSLP